MLRLTGFLELVLASFCVIAVDAQDSDEALRVVVHDVHYCCRDCQTAIYKAVSGVDGTTGLKFADGVVSFRAPSRRRAQAALDALAAAGFHGSAPQPGLSFPDDSGAQSRTVSQLRVTGTHNCCGACAATIRRAVAAVPGVTRVEVEAEASEFEVGGRFDERKLIEALNAVGFHGKVARDASRR